MNAEKRQIVKGITLFPLYLTFFVMGFADLVGIATNYVREEYLLSDSAADLIPVSQYVWFLLLSVPTGILMSRIGRRRTVIAGLAFTALGMLVPLLSDSFTAMLPAFALIGIGVTVLGVGLNPLLASLVPDNRLASSITIGQTVKALASIATPAIASMAAAGTIRMFGLGWRAVFAICLIIVVSVIFWLALTHIEETVPQGHGAAVSFESCLSLLKVPAVLAAFLAVVCHVGSDVSLNIMLPQFFEQRLGVGLNRAAFATSLYFAARLAGSIAGIFVLRRISIRKFLISNLILLTLGIAALAIGRDAFTLEAATVLLGLGNASICTMIISSAFISLPERRNEISSLTMMGLCGGAVFSLISGAVTDGIGLTASLVLILAATAYIFLYAVRHTR